MLILRYVPPDVVPLPSSLQEAIDSVSLKYRNTTSPGDSAVGDANVSNANGKVVPPEKPVPVLVGKESTVEDPLIEKVTVQLNCKLIRCKNIHHFYWAFDES